MPSIEKSQVSLAIYGDNLDPDELSLLLKNKPTVYKRKGQVTQGKRIKSKSFIATTGFWGLTSGLDQSKPLEEKINDVLVQVTENTDIWKNISQHYRTRIFCGIFLTNINEGFSLSPEVLKKLSDRGLKIDFDIYNHL